MTPDTAGTVFHKRYPTVTACAAAAANHRWLTRLEPPLRLPYLLLAGERQLTFTYIRGRHATPADLEPLAAHLGHVHGHAYTAELHQARLDTPYRTATGHVLPAFIAPRIAAVRRRLDSGRVPAPHLSADHASRLLSGTSLDPAAFYKDTNPRNILITGDGPVTVDFDDLDLAPFGYDLAKLVVTLALTHGALPAQAIDRALRAYNTASRHHAPSLDEVTWSRLMAFAEIHHILTSPYLGRGGYCHDWHTVTTGPHPDEHAQPTTHELDGAPPWP